MDNTKLQKVVTFIKKQIRKGELNVSVDQNNNIMLSNCINESVIIGSIDELKENNKESARCENSSL